MRFGNSVLYKICSEIKNGNIFSAPLILMSILIFKTEFVQKNSASDLRIYSMIVYFTLFFKTLIGKNNKESLKYNIQYTVIINI